MAIDLLKLQPHKVSRDLSGYITYIYGAPKTGKTTIATQMEGSLLLAFEAGYNALPGVVAQDILTWGEMKQVYRELKKPEVQQVYKAIIVDTIDIAADRCKKYICQQNGIEDLGDLGYGKGWTKFKDEFNEVFRGLTQLGYAVFFIGHHKEVTLTDPATNADRMVIRPALSNATREVIAGMADIYGYAHQLRKDEMSVLTLRCTDGSIECGCRFKYIPNEIIMNYRNLVNAIQTAIDKEAEELGGKYVTEERSTVPVATTYNYEALMKEFSEIVGDLMVKNQVLYGPKITAIVDKYLGRGKKVSEATEEQAEFIHLIVDEIKKDLLG
jgi:hypothetical protein